MAEYKTDIYHSLLFDFCSDTGKLICLICMSVRESWYKSTTENN